MIGKIQKNIKSLVVIAVIFAMIFSALASANFMQASNSASVNSNHTQTTLPTSTVGSWALINNSLSAIPLGAVPLLTINLNQNITVFIGLSIQNKIMLDQMLQDLYTPSSIFYRHYVTHQQFVNLFEPSESQYNAVSSYYKSFELTVIPSNDRLYIQLYGSLLNLQNAFHTTFKLYQIGSQTYYFNTDPLYVPSQFSSLVTSVMGFTDYSYIKPMALLNPASGLNISQIYATQNGFGGAASPQPPYTPYALQLAYNETGLLAKGFQGQYETIAVTDAYGDPTAATDLALFDAMYNLANPPSFQIMYPYGEPNLLGTVGQLQGAVVQLWEIETALDFEMAHTFAPQANIISVVSPDSGYTLIQSVIYLIINQLANVISNSWGMSEPLAGSIPTYFHPFALMAAAEGITLLAASGDSGAAGYDSAVPRSIMWPGDDPYITVVGGTTLAMNGTISTVSNPLNGPPSVTEVFNPTSRAYETAWDGYTGGGYSVIFNRPSWQHGYGLPTTGEFSNVRGVPDVSSNAMFGGNDFVFNGLTAGSYLFGGTSFASPMWAGIVAAIDSYQTYYQGTQLGFLNPALYEILNSPVYNQSFYDITTGFNGPNGYYNATPGWDPVTGLGTANIGFLAKQLAEYSFSAGVYGDFRTAFNKGAAAQIQTVTPENVLGSSADYFYINEQLADGTQLLFGYAVTNAYPSGTWFYGVLPSISQYETIMIQFGANGAVGASGTLNNYKILETQPGIWSFELNNNLIASISDTALNTGKNAPMFMASTMGVTSSYNQLGPILMSNLKYYDGYSWILAPSAKTLETTSIFSSFSPPYSYANPYGVALYSASSYSIKIGSNVPYQNGKVLWGTFENWPVTTVLMPYSQYVTLYANNVSVSGTSLPSSYPMSTQFPYNQSDLNAGYLLPGPVSPVTWTFTLNQSTQSSIYLDQNNFIYTHFYASLNSLISTNSTGVIPLTVVASLDAGANLIGTGVETQNLSLTGNVSEFNITLNSQMSKIPANSNIVLIISWYMLAAAGEDVSAEIVMHSGQNYPISVSLPMFNPVDVSPLKVIYNENSITISSNIKSPFGSYDLKNVVALLDGNLYNKVSKIKDTYTWTVDPSQYPKGTYNFTVITYDIQNRFNENFTLFKIGGMPGIVFVEKGLPDGTVWSVTLNNNVKESSQSNTITFLYLANGQYSYSINTASSYAPVPNQGTVTISGASVTVTIQFLKLYSVQFTEAGLPSGTVWSVALNGAKLSSSTTALSFSEINGSYQYVVGNIPGYKATPSSGSVTVNGNDISVSISFVQVIYYVTFTESGLASNTQWSVTLNNLNEVTNGQTIIFQVSNGSYTFAVGQVSGYTANPSSGTVKVKGADLTVHITFTAIPEYNVIFKESGLATGTMWSITLSQTTLSSSSNSITFTEPDGSYKYTVGNVNGYTTTPSSGSVTVNGKDVTVTISFTQGMYYITFTETGLPLGTQWNVNLDNTTISTNSKSIIFSVPNGTYSYNVSIVSGFVPDPSSGTVKLSGNNEEVSIIFIKLTSGQYTITFIETGLAAGTDWAVTLNNTVTEHSNGNTIIFIVNNGTYLFTVGKVSGYVTTTPTGTITVNGNNVTQNLVFTPVPVSAQTHVGFFNTLPGFVTLISIVVLGTLSAAVVAINRLKL